LSERPDPIHHKLDRIKTVLQEIRRRKMIRAAVTYLVAAWVLIEVSSVVVDAFNLPDIVMQGLIGLAILGLPVAMVLAWIYDITARGIVRTADAEDGAETADEAQDEPRTRSQRRHMTMLRASISVEAHGDVDHPASVRRRMLDTPGNRVSIGPPIGAARRFAGRAVQCTV
jgi:hypothetical protein